MFLRKTIKSFGLFALIFCISISTQNEIITVKAANNVLEIKLEDKGVSIIDTIQPSQIYTIQLNPKNRVRTIDDLSIGIGISGKDEINIVYDDLSGDYHGYHYLVSIWVNGINVTKDKAIKRNSSHYSFINDWAIIAPGNSILNNKHILLDFPKDINKDTFLDTELKIQKIKCNEMVITEEPTCATDGIIKHACQTCGYITHSEPIKATGHTYSAKQINYPTVYNAGTIDLYCTKCGDESISEIPQYEFNVSIGGSQLKAIRLSHKLLFANTHKDAKYIPFVVPNGKSVLMSNDIHKKNSYLNT